MAYFTSEVNNNNNNNNKRNSRTDTPNNTANDKNNNKNTNANGIFLFKNNRYNDRKKHGNHQIKNPTAEWCTVKSKNNYENKNKSPKIPLPSFETSNRFESLKDRPPPPSTTHTPSPPNRSPPNRLLSPTTPLTPGPQPTDGSGNCHTSPGTVRRPPSPTAPGRTHGSANHGIPQEKGKKPPPPISSVLVGSGKQAKICQTNCCMKKTNIFLENKICDNDAHAHPSNHPTASPTPPAAPRSHHKKWLILILTATLSVFLFLIYFSKFIKTRNEENGLRDDWTPPGILHFSSHFGPNGSSGSNHWKSTIPYCSAALAGSNQHERPSSSHESPHKRRKSDNKNGKGEIDDDDDNDDNTQNNNKKDDANNDNDNNSNNDNDENKKKKNNKRRKTKIYNKTIAVTWNCRKKGFKAFDNTLGALLAHVPTDATILFQEAENWRRYNNSKVKGTHVYHSHIKSSAAILMPTKITDNIKGEPGFGEDWFGVKTDKHIYISIHANDITKNDEATNFPERCTDIHKWIGDSNNHLTTIIGIDANTTLLPNMTNITGQFTLPPLPSHNNLSRNRILNIIELLGLKALQTYAQKGFDNLVTRSENNSRSQIYYILIPQHKKLKAYVSKTNGKDADLKSDHHPIIVYIEEEDTQTTTEKKHATTPSTKGWIPKTIIRAMNFKNRIMTMLNITTTLQQAISMIHETASTTAHTTLNSRKRPKNTTYNRNIRTITAQIALGCHPREAVKILRKKCNRQKRLRRNNVNTTKVQDINSHYHVNNNINQLHYDNNNPIPEDQLLIAAERFGTKRFNTTTTTNNTTKNNNRIDAIKSNIKAEMADGKLPQVFSFFDTMQARARLRAGKGQDKEGTANEMILCLPYYAVLQIHFWFLQLYQLCTEHPEQWKNVDFKGIPKTRDTDRFSKFRWIAGINTYRQWYNRIWERT